MPRTVTAGRAQMRSATVPVPISSTPSSTLRVRAELRLRVLQSLPARRPRPSPSTVVEPSSARSESSTRISAASASGAAPPNWPECRLPSRVSTCDAEHRHPAQRGGDRRQTDPEVARVADDDGVGGQQLGVRLRVPLQTAGALLLRALGDHLDGDRHAAVRLERAQREQVHDQAALAVGRAAPVPAAVALGQLERRGEPGGLVQRRLHVVVRVEQHGRGAGRAGQAAVDRLGAVGGVEQRRRPGSPRRAVRRRPSCAAASHSLFGNCAGSATDWKATSSASSALARGISEATVSAIGCGGHGHAPGGCDVMCRIVCTNAVGCGVGMYGERTCRSSHSG